MLPAVVVGGWLGAGKTTLVNRLLRAAGGRRIAVLVNDFGDVGIDADLIVSREGSVMDLAGGCVCCAVGSDLVEALVGLAAKTPGYDLALVETSGVALPAAVARAARLVQGVEVEGTVVLVDAETVRARADDRHVGDTVRRQLAEADLLVLNKVDLVPAGALPALHAWLRDASPRAALVDAVDAAVPPALVLGVGDAAAEAAAGVPPEVVLDGRAGDAPGDTAQDGGRHVGATPGGATGGGATGDGATGRGETGGGATDACAPGDGASAPGRPLAARRPAPAATTFVSASFDLDGGYDLDALAAALADPALGLVRAKGTMRDASGARAVLQAVGARVRSGPAPAGSAAAAPDAPSRLVVIGLRDALDAPAIAARIAGARRVR